MQRLYVIIRSDLESMTPGKAAAQVGHASTQAALRMCMVSTGGKPDIHFAAWSQDAFVERSKESKYPSHAFEGFGTQIVLDGGSGEDLERDYYAFFDDSQDFSQGMVVDPSYPIRDGRVVHHIEMLTCIWAFGDPEVNRTLEKAVKKYSLYNGNK